MPESVWVKGEGGSVIKMDLPLPEPIQERLQKGYLRQVDENGNPISTTAPARPAVNASKAEWVGWAVHESKRRGDPITPDQAEAATKQDLIEKFGITE
jgi:hypothetical protein